MMSKTRSYGAEIEKPVSSLSTFQSYPVSQNFFKSLKRDADRRKVKNHYHFSDIEPKTILGIVSDDLGEQGLDNGFNLLETSLPYQKSLTELHKKILLDLKTTQEALKKEGASITNLAGHPLGKRDLQTYKRIVAPKGVYQWLWYRGWDHTVGIDAKAQNSPTTGVSVWEAADAVSSIIGAGAALIALFANSPYEESRKSPFKESRLMLWERMMGHSKSKADLITARFPENKFHNLAQYFNWMFDKKTQIYFVLARSKTRGKKHSDYKSIRDEILVPREKLSVLEYLSKKECPTYWFKEIDKKNRKVEIVIPNIADLEVLQFCQFTGARIRFKLKHQNNFPLKEFLKACKENSNQVEKIFDQFSEYVYIEGRDPGANFPDQQMVKDGKEIANSVVISPSAIQAGLIKNLKRVIKFLEKYPWKKLNQLRQAAIKDGLEGKTGNLTVEQFTQNILQLAEDGLDKDERWMLDYPRWVLETKQNGADRAVEFVKNHKKGGLDAIVNLVKERKVVI